MLGQAGLSRNSFRNKVVFTIPPFAKFRAKFDSWDTFPIPKLGGKGIVRDRHTPRHTEAEEKIEIQPPKSPFSTGN